MLLMKCRGCTIGSTAAVPCAKLARPNRRAILSAMTSQHAENPLLTGFVYCHEHADAQRLPDHVKTTVRTKRRVGRLTRL
jgi:hypothetical protein